VFIVRRNAKNARSSWNRKTTAPDARQQISRWTTRSHNLGLLAAARSPGMNIAAMGNVMDFEQTKDDTLLRFYEGIRQQVDFDIRAGSGQHRIVGQGVKQYAEKLRVEMDRRRLRFTPIDWR
jgi:hypothetical protein